MRVRREAAAVLQLATEVLELLQRDAAFEERAGVDARRGVALEEDDVAVVTGALALEEVVEADLVERRRRSERRDVPADAVTELVGADDHRERVPADEALDAAFDGLVAGKRRLLRGRDRVDVGRARGERQAEAGLASMKFELAEQIRRASNAATLLQDVLERVLPFPGLERFDGRVLIDRDVSHGIQRPLGSRQTPHSNSIIGSCARVSGGSRRHPSQ